MKHFGGAEPRGFTLLEIMVALGIAALMIGSVLGLISESMRYKVNLKQKAQIQPLLESAAEIILADPIKATEGFIRLDEFEGSPSVGIALFPVPVDDSMAEEGAGGRLCRVVLSFNAAVLEFSIIVPNEESQGPNPEK